MTDEQAETIWRELAFGYWQVLAAVDADGTRHVAIVPAASRPVVDWSLLRERERLVLAMVARGLSQKSIALRLGLSRSAISAAFQMAKERLGFRSASELVRACQGEPAKLQA
jgi:DNA-binding CsgD family transcriptional regulator